MTIVAVRFALPPMAIWWYVRAMRSVVVAVGLVLAVSSAGCGARAFGPGAVGAMPPPPRPGSVVRAWEHYCVAPGRDFDEVLAQAGKAGWEMVSAAATQEVLLLCFKRPVTAPPP